MTTCPCSCHTGAFTACDIGGGCGHLHRDERRPTLREVAVALGGQVTQGTPSTPSPAPPAQPGEPVVLTPWSPEHRCYRGERCTHTDKVDQLVCHAGCSCHNTARRCGDCQSTHRPETVRIGAQIVAAHGLCLRDQQIVGDAITELPRDYVELHLALERGGAGLHEHVAATKDLPAALRVNVAALAAEIVRVAAVWAEPVADRLRIDWDTQAMDAARPGFVLQRATRLLTASLSVLLALRGEEVQAWADNGWYHTHEPADGVDGALNLLHLHQVARSALGQTKLVHQLPAPCPACDAMALARDDGDSFVHCQRCRLRWTEEDYARLVLVVLSDARASVA